MHGRTRHRDRFDEWDQLGEVIAPDSRVGETLVALQRLEAERAAEGAPVRRRGRADHDVPIGHAHRLIGRDEPVRRRGGVRHLTGGEVRPGLPHRERHRRLEHRDVEELAAAIALTHAERREDGDRGVEPGREV